jgi:hypothetical protein
MQARAGLLESYSENSVKWRVESRMTPTFTDWADSLEIRPVRVGQALGPHYLEDTDDPIELETALKALIDHYRPEVFEALVKGFGNESSLFLSLWRASEGGAIDEPEECAESVLNEGTPERMKAFEWITEGMPSLD